jgi:hypothetical protein
MLGRPPQQVHHPLEQRRVRGQPHHVTLDRTALSFGSASHATRGVLDRAGDALGCAELDGREPIRRDLLPASTGALGEATGDRTLELASLEQRVNDLVVQEGRSRRRATSRGAGAAYAA